MVSPVPAEKIADEHVALVHDEPQQRRAPVGDALVGFSHGVEVRARRHLERTCSAGTFQPSGGGGCSSRWSAPLASSMSTSGQFIATALHSYPIRRPSSSSGSSSFAGAMSWPVTLEAQHTDSAVKWRKVSPSYDVYRLVH